MSMIDEGKYIARATGRFELGRSPKGTDTIAVEFEILEGAFAGAAIVWFGFFTEDTEDRTIEALRYAGWQGDDVTTLDGLGSRRVELVIEHEEYDGKTRAKVRWVNRIGGGVVKLNNPMDDAARRQFAARMKGKAKSKPALPPEDNNGAAPQPRSSSSTRAAGQAAAAGGPPDDRWGPAGEPPSDDLPF